MKLGKKIKNYAAVNARSIKFAFKYVPKLKKYDLEWKRIWRRIDKKKYTTKEGSIKELILLDKLIPLCEKVYEESSDFYLDSINRETHIVSTMLIRTIEVVGGLIFELKQYQDELRYELSVA